MPRSRSSSSSGRSGMFGGGSSRSSTSHATSHAAPAKPAPAAHPPAAAPAAPAPVQYAPAPSGGGGGFLSSMVQGFALGTGSAVAHRMVGGLMGGGSGSRPEEAAAPVTASAGAGAPMAAPMRECDDYQRLFAKCLADNKSDISMCQRYMDDFNTCKSSMGGATMN